MHLAASVSRASVDARSRRDIDLFLVGLGRCAHSFLDLSGHGKESLFNIGSVLGRGFQEWDTETIGEFLLG
jgi:hypothetical protein